MKAMHSGRHRTPANYFSVYVYASHLIFGVFVRRAIYFFAFWSNFLAYNTPVRPLTEALIPEIGCCDIYRSLPKLVTVSDLERPNDCHFALFHNSSFQSQLRQIHLRQTHTVSDNSVAQEVAAIFPDYLYRTYYYRTRKGGN